MLNLHRAVFATALLLALTIPCYAHSAPSRRTQLSTEDSTGCYVHQCGPEERNRQLAAKNGLIICFDHEPVYKAAELRWEINLIQNDALTRSSATVEKLGDHWCASFAGCQMYQNVLATLFTAVPDGTTVLIGGLGDPSQLATAGTVQGGRYPGMLFVRNGEVQMITMVPVFAPEVPVFSPEEPNISKP